MRPLGNSFVKNSAIIKHLVGTQKEKIAAGVYSLATGKVELVDLASGKVRIERLAPRT
jgi:hypothetical protein